MVAARASRENPLKIVVTGALGHIGSALIRHEPLLRAAHQIVLVDDLSTQRYASAFDLPSHTAFTMLPGDVTQIVTRELLDGCDAVIHLAAITEAAASVERPEWVFENNLRITSHVAEMCRETATPLVMVSSTSVYTPVGSEVDESSPAVDPTTPYAQCKLAEEAVVREEIARGLMAIIFRFGTIFGTSPGMRFHTAVNKFCWQASLGQPLSVWETAMDQRRPYLALGDAVAAITHAVAAPVFPGDIVNAVTCDATVREVIEQIEANGVRVRVDLVRSAAMTDTSYTTSTARAAGLGFTFTGSLAEGVRDTLRLLDGLIAADRRT